MKQGFKLLVLICLFLSTSIFCDETPDATWGQEASWERATIKNLEKEFFNTAENDYQKLAEISRKISYLCRKRARSGCLVGLWTGLPTYGLGWLIGFPMAISNNKKANRYEDLHKFYAIEMYYSREENSNLSSAPIIYRAGKAGINIK